jgi:OOP family OmpA-OmpF porin
MKRTILLAVLAALAGTAAAQSQGAYVGGNVGRAEQKITIEGFSEKDHDTGFKLYGGYNFNQYFGLEGGYADLGKLELSALNSRFKTEPTSVYFAATGTLPLDAGFSLFGKAGIARTEVKAFATDGFDSVRDKASRSTAYVSVGAAYAINTNFSVVAEYEYFGKVAKLDGVDGDLKANMVSVGVRYKF